MSEELALTVVEPQEPALVRIGERSLSKVGFRTQAAWEHLAEHDSNGTHCDPGCFAKTMWGQSTKANRRQASARVSGLRLAFAERSRRLLVVEYGHAHSRITSFYLLPIEPSTADLQVAQVMMAKLQHNKELSQERKQLLLDLFNEALSQPESDSE